MLQQEVRWRTPLKTGTLIENIEISEVDNTNWVISQKVFTDLEKVSYAWIVEWWVEWKSYNYHIDWIPFKQWVWAEMYWETVELIIKKYQFTLWNIAN